MFEELVKSGRDRNRRRHRNGHKRDKDFAQQKASRNQRSRRIAELIEEDWESELREFKKDNHENT